MIIRQGTVADVVSMYTQQNLSKKALDQLTELETKLTASNSSILVIEDVLKRVQGYVEYNKLNQYKTVIKDIQVLNSRKGFGTQLIEHLSKETPTLEMTTVNTIGQSFLKKAGFTTEKDNIFVLKKEPIKSLIVHNKSNLPTRYEELDGIKYLVAPVIMTQEQVMNDYLLPAEEIQKSVNGWNGRPVLIYHPKVNGQDVSANSPDISKEYEIGTIFNTKFENNQLKAEIWVDVSKAQSKNGYSLMALNMIEQGQPLDVSTGYFVRNMEDITGDFNGKSYQGIERDIMPDHLALLPQQIGACSYEDGCGVRTKSESGGIIKGFINKIFGNAVADSNVQAVLRFNELSNRELNESIREAIGAKFGKTHTDIHIVDFYPESGYVIFETYNNKPLDGNYYKYFKVDYSESEDVITIGDTPIEVVKKTLYKIAAKGEKNEMKNEMIDTIIANSNGAFTGTDRLFFEKMTECDLYKLVPTNHQAKFKANCSDNQPTGEVQPVVKESNGVKPVVKEHETLENYIDNIPDSDAREFIKGGILAAKKEKEALIANITGIENNPFTTEALNIMTNCQLSQIWNFYGMGKTAGMSVPVTNRNKQTNYGINGMQALLTTNAADHYTEQSVDLFNPVSENK